MGEFGLKIKNISSGSLYMYNLGVRAEYEDKDAMLTNSLFLDFLLENGLNAWKGKQTRDIVCIDFNYGSSSFDEEVDRLEKCIEKLDTDKKYEKKTQEEKDRLRHLFSKKIEDATINKDKFVKKSKKDIRKEYYKYGFNVDYPVYKRDGSIKSREVIHYKMLYRTTGKAKKGSCMFINENLYDVAQNFLRMGIQIPETNSPIVEMGAYSSLITSSIVGRIRINPKNILVLNDVDSFFETNAISVETNEDKQCIAKLVENYKLKNTLFDGQALIDSSLFPEWGNGYILLRHHLCKMAAFCSNIQLFFQDYYGDNYSTAVVADMWGNEHYAKDIELITTDNAMKWLKFDVSYDYWCDWVFANNCMFGIVKTAHESKLGEVQRMSYQMVNALDESIMDEVSSQTKDYVMQLKTDIDVFLDYLKKNSNFSNDYEVLIALCEQDYEFTRSEYFRDRKTEIIRGYIKDIKHGRIITNADNLVIIGSPYAMLLHSVGEDVEKDPTFTTEQEAIQCYTGRFEDGSYLAEFRSPFNSKNNLGHLHNVYHEYFYKYFNFGKQIIAVNMINTDFQDMNNGSDMDSDSIYTTDNKYIVDYARYCYLNYHTIVNNIPKEKNIYDNTLEHYAIMDNNLAAAQRAIGESSNLAQLCLTYSYNFDDQKYNDYVCILSVLAQVAIDNAKRRFDIDLVNEIARIKNDMDVKHNKYPVFWKSIKNDFAYNKINTKLKCPMNYLCDLDFGYYRNELPTLPMSTFFIDYKPKESKRRVCKKTEEFIEKYSTLLYDFTVKAKNEGDAEAGRDSELLLLNDFDDMVKDLRQTSVSGNYLDLMMWMIDRAFCITDGAKRNKHSKISTLEKNKSILLKTLYCVNKKAFLQCFSKNIS